MQVEDYLEVIGPDAIRIKGHRIGLEHLVELYQDGYSAEQIQLELPTLSLQEIDGVITYYLHHQAEVEAYLARQAATIARELAEAPAPSPAMQRIRARLAERKRTGQPA